MPHPKSPLDKTSHSRRPAGPRRSSSDSSSGQATSASSSSSRHGTRPGHLSLGKIRDAAANSPSAVAAKPDARSNPKSTAGDNSSSSSRRGHGQGQGQGADSLTQEDQQHNMLRRRAEVESGSAPVAPAVESPERVAKNESKTEVPLDVSPEEVERLHAAMDAQLQLSQHREKLALQLGSREPRSAPTGTAGRTRVSPIHEETISPTLAAAVASPTSSNTDSTPINSANTLRGGPASGVPLRTPSYPFPSMRTPVAGPSSQQQRPSLSSSGFPSSFTGTWEGIPHDQMLSGSITPASALNFQPGESQNPQDDPAFPSPNLYDLSLMLSAEPGLDAWWTTVVQIMRDLYRADRVTLSVPADSTDVENVPWGQKATFNVIEEDAASVGYLPRGSSVVPSSVDANETLNLNLEDVNADERTPTSRLRRPGLMSRHSFTAFEDTKPNPLDPDTRLAEPSTPAPPLVRAKSYLSARYEAPVTPVEPYGPHSTQLNMQSLRDHEELEDRRTSAQWESSQDTREVRGKVFPVLQALDYEADPLIDSSGVLRVLERGRVIALTRDYPYLEPTADKTSSEGTSAQPSGKAKENPPEKTKKGKSPEQSSRITQFLAGKSLQRTPRSNRSHGSDKRKSTPAVDDPLPHVARYEEYEQTPRRRGHSLQHHPPRSEPRRARILSSQMPLSTKKPLILILPFKTIQRTSH